MVQSSSGLIVIDLFYTGKRKRGPVDVLEYLERADEKFLEHSRDMNNVLLQKLDEHATAYVALMGRMVTLMEAQLKK